MISLTQRRARLSCLALAVAAALGCPALAAAQEDPPTAPQSVASELYVINLESTTMPIKPSDRPALAGVKDRTLYVVPIDIRGVTWYRLRMGFFNSKKEAEAVLAKLEDAFPDGWVARVDAGEVKQATSGAPAHAPTLPPPPNVTAGGGADADLMRQGRDAMLVGDFARAIRLYTKVLESQAGPYAQDARELLGLARERNGQLPQARAEYETYLKLYPHGEGAERVRQRLLGLVTARASSPEQLRAPRADTADKGWRGFGSFAQYVRWDQFTYGGVTSEDTLFISDLDYTARRRGADYDMRARFSGQYWPASSGSRTSNDGRVSTLYAEALSTGNGVSGSVGRQSRSDSGILGRFDGVIVSKPLGSRNRLNFAAGLPVDTGHEDRINSHKQFFGVSLDAGRIAGAFDTNTYFIQQQVDGVTDRQAVGSELRYLKDGRSFFALVDYDISYATVNTALALAGWTRADGAALNLILDYRKTPILTTSNALISQDFATVADLLDTMSESQARQLAQDRTALSRSATLSASMPLNRNYQIMGDVTVASLTGTPPSGDTTVDPATGLLPPGSVLETPSTGTQTYYSVQLIGGDLLKAGDSTIFGTRYTDEQNGSTVSISVNHRRPVSERFYLNPKVRLDFRQHSEYGDENTVALALRATNQYLKDLWLEVEAGGEWRDHEVSSGDGSTSAYFVYAGFRKDF